MSKQRAFHNNMQIRQFHVERVLAHQLANEIMQGTSWREDAAGAVGCTLESNQHSRYEEELGIPRQLAYLEDRIFEGVLATWSIRSKSCRFLGDISGIAWEIDPHSYWI